jgi:hypothetical protein
MKKNLLIGNLLTILLLFSIPSFAQSNFTSPNYNGNNGGINANIYADTVQNGLGYALRVSETIGGALPPNSSSFAPVTTATGVTLDWATATKTEGWYIEKSPAININLSWTDLGFVNSSGNSSTINDEYSFTDNNVLSGKWYYRLKQLNEDGSIAYSNTILVKTDLGEKNIQLTSYPNPFRSSATIHFTVPIQSKVSLQLYNMEGQLINTILQENMNAGTYEQPLNDQLLASGSYLLKLNADTQIITSIVIKTQ